MLVEEFLTPMGITQRDLAEVSMYPISALMNLLMASGESRQVQLRLAKYFGTSPDFWINQVRCDLYRAQITGMDELKSIKAMKNGDRVA